MTTTEIELVSPTGEQGYLEANKHLVEQCAVQALMSIMNSNCSPDVKLAASAQAFDILGKSKPQAQIASNTTNIQINAALAGKAGEALAGMVKTLSLMGQSQNLFQSTSGENAPQSFTGSHENASIPTELV